MTESQAKALVKSLSDQNPKNKYVAEWTCRGWAVSVRVPTTYFVFDRYIFESTP